MDDETLGSSGCIALLTTIPLIPPLTKGNAATMRGLPNNPVIPALPALAADEDVEPARDAAPADCDAIVPDIVEVYVWWRERCATEFRKCEEQNR